VVSNTLLKFACNVNILKISLINDPFLGAVVKLLKRLFSFVALSVYPSARKEQLDGFP
jgi:hypothetical protein